MPDATRETWKPVPGYEGLYEVSDLGRVRSLPRPGGNNRTYGGKIIKGVVKTPAYEVVALSRYGTETRYRVHNLVALVFIGPRPPGQEVRHGPNGRLDNSLANLCYGTRAENAKDRTRDGTLQRGERSPVAKLTNAEAAEIRHRAASGELHRCLAREFGVSQSTVTYLVGGRTYT